VLMVRAARSATTAARTDHIVGRAEQRARLGRTLDDVIDDGSRFVIIGGDAGVGKTTVVEAFVADLFGVLADRKAQLIRGQCVPMGDEAPLAGIPNLALRRERVPNLNGAELTGYVAGTERALAAVGKAGLVIVDAEPPRGGKGGGGKNGGAKAEEPKKKGFMAWLAEQQARIEEMRREKGK